MTDFENKYRTKGTYLIWDKKALDVLRWHSDKTIYFADKQDAENTIEDCKDNNLKIVTAEELLTISEKHYHEYLGKIDTCIESGEIELMK